MKFINTILLVLAIVSLQHIPCASASSLRSSDTKTIENENSNWEEVTDETENGNSNAVSILPSEFPPIYNPHVHRRLNIDTINGILAELLPKINSALQQAVPDPFLMPPGGSFGLGCNSLAMTYDFGELRGLSSINIDSLTVQAGTESTEQSSCNSLWEGTINTVISFGQSLTGGLSMGLSGNCLTDFSNELGGTATSDGSKLTGVTSMKGVINACRNSITFADIADALQVRFCVLPLSMNACSCITSMSAPQSSQFQLCLHLFLSFCTV